MKKSLFLFLGICLSNVLFAFSTSPETRTWTDKDEQVLKDKLMLLDSPVQVEFNSQILDNVKAYTTYGYKGTEIIIAKMGVYFPIIEQYLAENNLPQQLKYMAMIESGLKPQAKSPVGAVGLWQLMPATASELGLKINHLVDERKDVHKSTQAAINLLSKLHKEFGNWELAMCAYNCGAGNVRKAIRKSGSRNFKQVKNFLPTETRAYIPRFVAASYIAENYIYYNIIPKKIDPNFTLTSTFKVYDKMSLQKVASLSSTPIHIVKKLNLAFNTNLIPASIEGHYITLPDLGAIRMQNQLRYENLPFNGSSTIYYVKSGDTLSKISNKYKCSVTQLRKWNQLNNDMLQVGQKIQIHNH